MSSQHCLLYCCIQEHSSAAQCMLITWKLFPHKVDSNMTTPTSHQQLPYVVIHLYSSPTWGSYTTRLTLGVPIQAKAVPHELSDIGPGQSSQARISKRAGGIEGVDRNKTCFVFRLQIHFNFRFKLQTILHATMLVTITVANVHLTLSLCHRFFS